MPYSQLNHVDWWKEPQLDNVVTLAEALFSSLSVVDTDPLSCRL